MSSMVHEVDASIARQFALRGAVTSPIKVVDLEDFGIDGTRFLNRIAPTFYELPFDSYDPALKAENLVRSTEPDTYRAHEDEWLGCWNTLHEHQYSDPPTGCEFWRPLVSKNETKERLGQISPHRRRSCFQYLVSLRSTDYHWQLREVGAPRFVQAVSDVRARPRDFSPCPVSVYRDEDIQSLIAVTCQLVCQTASVLASSFRVTLHQMLTIADILKGNEPAPEGVHQDGSQFIVSALVIERQNVSGGVSEVYYSKDKGLALRHQLKPGEGIFQSDLHNEYWHSVSPIFPVDAQKPAYRSILGLDIEFISQGTSL